MSGSRHSARRRLTLLYAGLFLLLGTLVLGVTYVLAPSSRINLTVSRAGTLTVSAQAKPPRVTLALPTGSRPSTGTQIRTQIPGGQREIVVEEHSGNLKKQLLAISWVVLLITVVAAALVGWFLAGRFLRPLRQMTDRARTISAGDLSQRVALAGPDDEFRQLGETFDALLGRLETSFDVQRRFVANAAHELRTPLTLERTLLQVALADPDVSAAMLRTTCEELLVSNREQEQVLEALLTLASSERGLGQREPVDLARAAQRAVNTYRTEADHRGVRFETSLEPAPVIGDAALIDRLIANLLDNAVGYNESGGRVEVSTWTEGARAIVSVSNTGPAISSDQVERLFEPFRRLAPDRAGEAGAHHGLGLSIVRAIAQAHDAELTATARPQGGLEVTVRFRLGGAIAPDRGHAGR